MQSRVSIVRCEDYQQEKVDQAVRQAIDLCGGLSDLIGPGTKVLVKVNLLSARKPDEAVTTHPAVVAALLDVVQKLGGEALVADESGFAFAGSTKQAAKVSGIRAVVDAKGARFAPFDALGFQEVPVPRGKHLKNICYARAVLNAEVVICLPKLKNHTQTIYSGAVKNMFGCVPTSVRMEAHRLSRFVDFSEAVVDIYSVVRPHFALMDAVFGMEGDGPSRGNPRKIGLVLASRDCVSLDATACRIIGYDPDSVVTTRSASQRGLGQGRPDRIEITGQSIADVRIGDFKRPSTRFLNLPTWFGNLLYRHAAARPVINKRRCKKCKVCYKTCPVNAIVPANKYYIDHDRCVKCYCCHELCPHDAVILKETLIGKLLS